MNYKRHLDELVSLPPVWEMLEYLDKYFRNTTLMSKVLKLEYSYLRRIIRGERKLNYQLHQRVVIAYLAARMYPRLPPLTKAVIKSLTQSELKEMKKFIKDELTCYQTFLNNYFVLL